MNLVAGFSAFSVRMTSIPSSSGLCIDNDQIGGIGAEQLNALLAIKCNGNLVGAANQQLRQNLGNDHFVVYNQDMFFANRKTSECDSPNREDKGRLSTDTTDVNHTLLHRQEKRLDLAKILYLLEIKIAYGKV
jgi:hypothetical protein